MLCQKCQRPLAENEKISCRACEKASCALPTARVPEEKTHSLQKISVNIYHCSRKVRVKMDAKLGEINKATCPRCWRQCELRFQKFKGETHRLMSTGSEACSHPLWNSLMFDECGFCGIERKIRIEGVSLCPNCGAEAISSYDEKSGTFLVKERPREVAPVPENEGFMKS